MKLKEELIYVLPSYLLIRSANDENECKFHTSALKIAYSVFCEKEMTWGRLCHHSQISTSEFLSFTAAYQYIDPRLSCAIRIAEQLFLMFDIMRFTSNLSVQQLKCAYSLSPMYCVTYSHVPGVMPQTHHRQLRS